MVKTYEKVDSTRWIDRLLNCWPFCLDTDSIHSVGGAWLFKENGRWRFKPRVTENVALFYNAVFFLRLSLPFGIFIHIRPLRAQFFQGGLGWKLNGRIALLFRFQNDASAAAGVSGPNYGQSQGFDYGTH